MATKTHIDLSAYLRRAHFEYFPHLPELHHRMPVTVMAHNDLVGGLHIGTFFANLATETEKIIKSEDKL